MTRRLVFGIAAAAAAIALSTVTLAAPPAQAGAYRGRGGLTAIGLTADQWLVRFDVTRPERAASIGRVSGLQGDNRLIGIDYRVQNSRLYGVGNAGGVYILSVGNASASKVSQLTVGLSGTSFGVDFNPAADRLRVISDTGQNLRHDVVGGTTTNDTTLTYPPAAGAAVGLVGAAYTNNDLNADTGTVLYDIDTNLDQVSLQSPANSGQLVFVGKLGVDAGIHAGFDIYSTLRGGNGVDLRGFATLTTSGRSSLYAISLTNGAAWRNGSFPNGWAVTDLALPLNQ
ncbi:uncharacterized protein DUF4394 [Asanoa ferruginea]|uniref:Uncharacterized protein DUF4394 n=2 Tax=Asanoa ferruginea TaxID=53367 RepID=A0A3D9ZXK2_9ACTN|nr:uncharacterized protein DUF4394 [Asanoa ferruginea]GIF47474.1 hypothetical protein Afe04nite_20130 [Asanoa ferruginea]